MKYNEAVAHNKALRENIDNLRRERLVFDQVRQLTRRLLAVPTSWLILPIPKSAVWSTGYRNLFSKADGVASENMQKPSSKEILMMNLPRLPLWWRADLQEAGAGAARKEARDGAHHRDLQPRVSYFTRALTARRTQVFCEALLQRKEQERRDCKHRTRKRKHQRL